jgi:hypothetical protein
VDPAAAQAGQLTKSQASAQEDQDMIPPGQGHAAEQSTGLFGHVGGALGLPEQLVGVGAPLGRGHLAHRVTGNGALILGELQDAMQDRSAGQQGLTADHGGQLACQRRISAGPIRSMGRSSNQGRT